MCKDSLESSFNVECAHGLRLTISSLNQYRKIRMSNAIQCDDFLNPYVLLALPLAHITFYPSKVLHAYIFSQNSSNRNP